MTSRVRTTGFPALSALGRWLFGDSSCLLHECTLLAGSSPRVHDPPPGRFVIGRDHLLEKDLRFLLVFGGSELPGEGFDPGPVRPVPHPPLLRLACSLGHRFRFCQTILLFCPPTNRISIRASHRREFSAWLSSSVRDLMPFEQSLTGQGSFPGSRSPRIPIEYYQRKLSLSSPLRGWFSSWPEWYSNPVYGPKRGVVRSKSV